LLLLRRTCTHTHTFKHTHTSKHTHTHNQTHMHIQTITHIFTHSYSLRNKHIHKLHTHTHADARTQIYLFVGINICICTHSYALQLRRAGLMYSLATTLLRVLEFMSTAAPQTFLASEVNMGRCGGGRGRGRAHVCAYVCGMVVRAGLCRAFNRKLTKEGCVFANHFRKGEKWFVCCLCIRLAFCCAGSI
jgi:hypothetical protein